MSKIHPFFYVSAGSLVPVEWNESATPLAILARCLGGCRSNVDGGVVTGQNYIPQFKILYFLAAKPAASGESEYDQSLEVRLQPLLLGQPREYRADLMRVQDFEFSDFRHTIITS